MRVLKSAARSFPARPQTLIDLAGSEKAASNIERLSEGKYINKSLLALGTVIETLADKTRKA